MYRSWRSPISSRVTNEIESSPVAPSPRRQRNARSVTASTSTGVSWRLSTSTAVSGVSGGSPLLIGGCGALLAVAPVRLHDVLHDLVANHVPRAHVDELDPLDPGEDLLDHPESRPLPGREVGLRDVAVDDGLG